MNISVYIGFAVLGLLAFLIAGYQISLMSSRFATPKEGDHVVEVWLEWPICTGSTMYRQRFRHRWVAYVAMRAHALMLDMELPTHWRSTDWSGRPCLERYDYGICYGMRRPTEGEREHGVPGIWSCVLPGHEDHAGEHREAHPLRAQELDGKGLEDLGYKI